jgi:CubicO group peptidase (beta-lactamase class C family)
MKNIAFKFLCSLVALAFATHANADDAIKQQILKLFPQADTNKDGVISDAEEAVVSRQALKRYPKADTDGDGVLSDAEKTALLRAAASRAKGKPAGSNANQGQPASLSELFTYAVKQGQVAGCSFLVVHKGKTVYREAFGYADLESKRPFTTDELCPIASVSKPFMASVLMVLVEQGKLKLDDPVEKYLPEFKGIKVKGGRSAARPMTLRHVLSHTAGFWGNKGITPEKLDLIRNFERPLAEAVRGIAKYDLEYDSGTRFQYSGAGYCVAGRVAEVALGQSLETIAQDALFRPLGLKRTTFLPSKDVRKTIPTAYASRGGKLQKQQSFESVEELRFILPGGSLFTTMDELAAFGQMHLNDGVYNGKRILSEASVAEMRRLQTPERASRTYGLGWFRDDVSESGPADLVYHNGALGAHLRVDRRRDVVTVFLVHQPVGPFLQLKNKRYQMVDEMFPLPGSVSDSPAQTNPETSGKAPTPGAEVEIGGQRIKVAALAQMLRSLDKNKDGKVQKAEVPTEHQRMFDLLDSNGDGVLTQSEVMARVRAQARVSAHIGMAR